MTEGKFISVAIHQHGRPRVLDNANAKLTLMRCEVLNSDAVARISRPGFC